MARRTMPKLFLGGFLLWGVAIVGCRRSEMSEPVVFPAGRFTSARQCGTCHRDIYAAWRGSQHARAAENPIFRESYEEAAKIAGDAVARLCFMCHAPTVVLTSDYALAQEVTREGVTCDFCHSLTGTDLERREHPFLLDVGATKYGPFAMPLRPDIAWPSPNSTSARSSVRDVTSIETRTVCPSSRPIRSGSSIGSAGGIRSVSTVTCPRSWPTSWIQR